MASAAAGRHSRRSSPPTALDASSNHFLDPSSMSTPIRNRRAARPSPEIDVWFQPPSSNHHSLQPHISFPISNSNSPVPSANASPSPFYSAKSSPTLASDSPRLQSSRTGLGLSWREGGSDAKRRKGGKQAISLHQVLMGGGALVAVTVLYFLLRGTSTAPEVKRMSREQRDRTGPRSSSMPTIFKSAKKRVDAASFRDELSSDMRYLTSPQHGDLAQQIMNFYHLTHLASVLSRIPLVAPFSVSHANEPPTSIPFSSIFDMPRFSQATSVSVVDWNDIRPVGAKEDLLGCWIGPVSDREMDGRAAAMRENGVVASFFPMRAKTSRTKAGEASGDALLASHQFIANFEKDKSAQSGLIEQALHTSSVSTLTASSAAHTEPESHVFCIDHTLYRPEHPTTAHSTTHLDPRDHTAFNLHGKALHFIPELQETALDVVAFLLGHRAPFIAVHISAEARAAECLLRREEDCSPRLSSYVEAVDRVRTIAMVTSKKSREQRHSVRALSVVVSTDITDLGFKGELAAAGWTLLDYEDLELRQRFGDSWLPAVMDQVVQSKAAAFVGTRGSAESTVSALRVKAWRSGPTELVY